MLAWHLVEACPPRKSLGGPASTRRASPSVWRFAAAQDGRRVYYGRPDRLAGGSKAAGRLNQRLKTLAHPAPLVIDEIGYLPISPTGAMLLFHLMSRRYEHGSTVLTRTRPWRSGATCSATRSWPPRSSIASSTIATSSPSAATASACASTGNSGARSVRIDRRLERPPGSEGAPQRGRELILCLLPPPGGTFSTAESGTFQPRLTSDICPRGSIWRSPSFGAGSIRNTQRQLFRLMFLSFPGAIIHRLHHSTPCRASRLAVQATAVAHMQSSWIRFPRRIKSDWSSGV